MISLFDEFQDNTPYLDFIIYGEADGIDYKVQLTYDKEESKWWDEIPVFWAETDQSEWEEVNSIGLLPTALVERVANFNKQRDTILGEATNV